MIPIIRDLSPESRDLLKRQIIAHFPESGVAGLYSKEVRTCSMSTTRLEIRCGITKEGSFIAFFPTEMLLIHAMPVLIAQMQKCRAEHARNKRAGRKAA
jgi:hypothetical protein